MTRKLQVCLAAVLALCACAARAAPAAIVDRVLMPAWLERAGVRVPLAPGAALRPNDRIRTGAGARVYLRLAEGSLVKLGESAGLRLAEVAPGRTVFRIALDVLDGAFRFTTDAVQRPRKRDARITVGTVTIGVRGTDLWGKSAEDRQVVVLIEGTIEVSAAGEAPVAMREPLRLYRREKGLAQPLAFIDPAQLERFAAETEIAAGAGAAGRGAGWSVTLLRDATLEAAGALRDALGTAGYASRVRPQRAGEPARYRVRIEGLPSRADAEALAARLRGTHGIAEPSVSR